MLINEAIEIHNTLNPILFENTEHLRPEIRNKIIDIVLNFEKYIKVPLDIIDVQLVGSQMSYNYTDKSDLDVHIIVNFDSIDKNTEILQSLYDAKKSEFNKDLDITIKGIEVELYIEDVSSGVVSNGIYSVCDDAWVKEPKQLTSIKNHDITDDLVKWKQKIEDTIKTGTSADIKNCINAIYLLRKNSIAIDGEYSAGNQLFKELRNLDLIKILKDKYKEKLSKQLSLEDYTPGQILNRLED